MESPPASWLRRTQGFTLLEVLVAMVILSIGLLGIVGLQAAALQAHRHARLQSSAVHLAQEMAEMLHGNASLLLPGAISPYLLSVTSPQTLTPPTCGLPGKAICATPQAAAQRDVALWWSRLQDASFGGLPHARAVICLDEMPQGLAAWSCSHAGSHLAIKIGWHHPPGRSSGVTTLPPLATPQLVVRIPLAS